MKPFNPELYSVFRSQIRRRFELRPSFDVERDLTEFSAVTGCHIIATFVFYGEAFGYSEMLNSKIASFLTFYKFDGLERRDAGEGGVA